MNGARRLALASLGASVAALTVGFVTGGDGILILPLGILAVLGLAGEVRASAWTPTFWFLAQTGLCALIWQSPVWALTSINGALAYWDLSAFDRRVVKAGRIESPGLMLGRHLLFLSAVLVVGAGLGFAALKVRLESGFAGALLFGLVALAGLSQLLRHAQLPTDRVDRLGAGQAERNS
ncbi:MAG: hypothetical protein ACRDHG_15655 [Anaerolineales bacterium]